MRMTMPKCWQECADVRISFALFTAAGVYVDHPIFSLRPSAPAPNSTPSPRRSADSNPRREDAREPSATPHQRNAVQTDPLLSCAQHEQLGCLERRESTHCEEEYAVRSGRRHAGFATEGPSHVRARHEAGHHKNQSHHEHEQLREQATRYSEVWTLPQK